MYLCVVYLYIYLSTYVTLSIYNINLYTTLIYLYNYLSTCLSIYFIYLCIYKSIYLSLGGYAGVVCDEDLAVPAQPLHPQPLGRGRHPRPPHAHPPPPTFSRHWRRQAGNVPRRGRRDGRPGEAGEGPARRSGRDLLVVGQCAPQDGRRSVQNSGRIFICTLLESLL